MSSSVQPPQYSELDPTGLNLTSFISSRPRNTPSQPPAQLGFPAFVTSVLQQSELDVSVAIETMALLRRYAVYQTAVAYNGDPPRLFLEAYMNAAKIVGYPQLMSFWQRV
ncbi:hypothetical protein BYT27DRAFT_6390175 [Phlegmacium glaucopus]|nr:hypothetical protein BYT27DRAFT_6390175 [Phlegmacium glaucopus]